MGWQVYWVPERRLIPADRIPLLAVMEDLSKRENRLGIHPGNPILLSPDYRIDELLSLYLCRSGFAKLAPETPSAFRT